MLIDFTFKNVLIKKYFDGDNSYIPVSEFMYLHEHPLIRESFLVQIEKKVHEAGEIMAKKNMQGKILNKFIECTMCLGAELENVTTESAPRILEELRKVNSLCDSLLK